MKTVHENDPDLFVNLVHEWKSERPRRPRCNVILFPVAVERDHEEPVPQGLTAGSVVVILLSLLALAAVLILLGVMG